MKIKLWPLLPIVAVTAALLAPTLGSGFVSWDDSLMVVDNPQVADFSAGGVRNIIFSFHHGLYHPLVNLSYLLEHRLFGFNPFFYHLTNLLLHLVNVCLAYIFICLLGGGAALAAGVALFFGLHPLHVESVAWIAERKDLLYAAFFLGGLVAYLRFLSGGNKWWYSAAWIFCLCSLSSKAMALSFPFILLSIDYLKGRRLDAKNLLEKLPFFLLAAFFAVLGALARPGSLTKDPPVSLANLFIGAYRLLFSYFARLFLPWLGSPLYPGATFSQKVFAGLPYIYYAAPLLAFGFFAWLFYLARRDRRMTFGLGFFLLALFPALFLIPVGPFADRFTYLSSLGLFFTVGLVIERIRWRRFAAVGLAVLLVVFSVMAWQRCAVWRDNYSLWSAVLQAYPHSAEANKDLALACLERGAGLGRAGRLDAALPYLDRALALEPDLAAAYFNRGNVYAALGKNREAAADWRRAVKLEPKLRLNLPPDFAKINS